MGQLVLTSYDMRVAIAWRSRKLRSHSSNAETELQPVTMANV